MGEPASATNFDSYLKKYIGDTPTLALLLDYDGTLTPIVKHPDLAVIPPETKIVLERLSKRSDVFIAVVSGRGVENVKKMVGIEGITYAGNHGLDIHHADGSKYNHPLPPEQSIEKIKSALEAEVCKNGAWIEDKGQALTFHFRNVEPENRPPIEAKAKELIIDAGFKVGLAHCAIECKPKVSWDKGKASILILKTVFGDDWTEKIKVIFAGDDVTDEDAMMALKGVAFSFRITKDSNTNTVANKILPCTTSVLDLLKWVEDYLIER